jgi:hypothetical protein
MSAPSAVGPYESFILESGNAAPFYLITFDKKGICQSPLTLARLLDDVKRNGYTDVHIFSHGWDNVFKDALQLYREFFGHYFRLRDQRKLNDPKRYRALVVGIVWPSAWLVLPWESTPKIAALPSRSERDEAESADRETLTEVASEIHESDRHRLFELAERGATLTPSDARELATILLPIYQRSANLDTGMEIEGNAAVEVTPEHLLALWSEIAPRTDTATEEAGFAKDSESIEVEAAGGALSWLDPRGPIRVASVLIMKDRAGTVGYKGVGPELVQKLLAQNNSRVHLIGHSFGCKVMLSALCCQQPSNPAASLLLLQPAISYLCFGNKIDGKGRVGGYRAALGYVREPILSTFSSNDIPLTRLFHLAVIRDSDWGELKIAGVPPCKFAALGGFGPGGLEAGESTTIAMTSPPDKYPAGNGNLKIIGLNGSNGQIKGHSDVRTEFTAWAHLNLVSGEQLP